ncbi:hypothetical protein C1T17_15130 [Sphingobium sp. SCG-1]|uniref:hypothetical protein n=1 Tax=Sphingobium sp. SCG-1 TaxID=2072936 RepID=UPI000CD6C61A|nr:hypothetical protein [Sphingobium sp. SCG-1]AUW59223.1 hypothetical protein C1T17_15130 [Sphingobium sp. SCG-1]
MAGREWDSESDEARERALHAKLDRTVQKYRSGNGALRSQMRTTRKDGWTTKRRAVFLEALAETCNVQEPARLVRMSVASAYDLRKRDTGFAMLWEEAKERGYERVEFWALSQIDKGIEQVETIRDGLGPDAKVKSVKTVNRGSLGYAIKLLAAHRASVERYRVQRAGLALEQDAGDMREMIQARLNSVRDHLVEQEARERALEKSGAVVSLPPGAGGGD